MSDGFCCKNCGWQETNHHYPNDIDDPENIIRGYSMSISRCPGFTLSKKDKKRKEKIDRQSEDEIEFHERIARERFAWGQYLAIMHQIKFKRTLDELPEEDREEFIRSCAAQNRRLIIG